MHNKTCSAREEDKTNELQCDRLPQQQQELTRKNSCHATRAVQHRVDSNSIMECDRIRTLENLHSLVNCDTVATMSYLI